jgi:twitching motility protein PilT
MPKIDTLLRMMTDNGASDLHIVVGQKPKFALHGEVVEVEKFPEWTEQSLGETMFEILDDEQREHYVTNWDLDFSYAIPDFARFRCNYYFQRTGYGAVFRIIPSKVMTLDQLKMPPVLKQMAESRSGLTLATGPTGSGKTTTLAAMVHHINSTQRRRVVTIEDPVEYVHSNINSIISHREVGTHTDSFENALRAVTRQDADVVLVGELRDLQTMALALSAAAMGTLVFGTLHTNSAAKTIDRIIDMFPSDQQPQVRTMLAESLRGIVAQQLLKTKDGKGRVAATEILIGGHAIASIIREGRIDRITSVIQGGRREGMQLMDDALERMVEEDVITGEDAYMKADDKKRFSQYMPDQ